MGENPSAFPLHPQISPDFSDERLFGMTLRDWFAGQVVSEYAKYGPNGHAPAEMVAAAAYEVADAMLKARSLSKDNGE